jgi:hypothetical protein
MAQQACVVLNAAQRKQLAAIAADRDRPRKHVERARVVNLTLDVDLDEAQVLIGLVELLFGEWYVAREQCTQHVAKLAAIAGEKKAAPAAETARAAGCRAARPMGNG